MDEKNMDNIYILQDEEGKDHEFELLDTCEKNGTRYYAMVPAEAEDKDDEFCEYVILKSVMVDGEESLVSIEDDDEFDDIADYFDDLFAEEIDYDARK
jgi:uncharacterized protein YrzB (UPF0473 family)